MSGCFEPR